MAKTPELQYLYASDKVAKMRGQSKNRVDGVAAALCAYAVVSWKHDGFFNKL